MFTRGALAAVLATTFLASCSCERPRPWAEGGVAKVDAGDAPLPSDAGPVARDAGERDAGVEDAGAPDAGDTDAGSPQVLDGGDEDAGTATTDAGPTDADAGAAPGLDAGPSPVDAGATDAGDVLTPDAGTSPGDAGAFDAGTATTDAGPTDADAGAAAPGLDAGPSPVDAGAPDAGDVLTPDAGRSPGDAGGVDAGPPDAGLPAPEACNGLDDDLDGFIDEAPDGAPLRTDCPLTLGVCATARSLCVDGGWAACDYGPDYQRTERKCDGLDNDCDGRVDRSWARTLFSHDGGPMASARFGNQELWVQPWGDVLIAVSRSAVRTLNQELELAAPPLVFPTRMYEASRLQPMDGAWLRMNRYPLLDQPGGCLEVHVVQRDGGYGLLPDGGFADARRLCTSGGMPTLGAITTPEGVVSVSGIGLFFSPGYAPVTWARFGLDGGLETRTFDAGLVGANSQVLVAEARDEFLVVHLDLNTNDSTVWSVPLDGSRMDFVRTYPGRGCFPDRLRTRGVACGRAVGQRWMTSWFDAADQLVTPEFDGAPAWACGPQEHQLAWRYQSLAWASPDGGAEQYQRELVELDGGTSLSVAFYKEHLRFYPQCVTELGGRLVLVTVVRSTTNTWDGPETFDAEYLCLP